MDRASRPISIAVVGAGPGGLAFARAAQLSGHDVQVFERQLQLNTRGGQVTLWQGIRCLHERLELGAALDAVGSGMDQVGAYLSGEDEPVFTHKVGGGTAARRMMRKDLVVLLASSLERGTIHFGKELDSVRADDDAGPVTLFFKDGASSSHDLVVGADGIRSRVRALLFGAEPPVFSEYRILTLVGTRGDRFLGPDGGSMNARFAAGSGGYLLHFCASRADGELVDNLALIFQSKEEATDAWDNTATKRAFAERMKHYCHDAGDYMWKILEAAEVAWDWGVYYRAPMESWTTLQGRVCLLGDACHATAPFLGQGANMAIQDAVCLADRLANMVPQAALQAYEDRRKPPCESIVQGSLEMADSLIAAADTPEAADELATTFMKLFGVVRRDWVV